MSKRVLFLLILIALLAAPVMAQDEAFDPVAWIPADYAGFLRVNLTQENPVDAIALARGVAALLQPSRQIPQIENLSSLISLEPLDVEDASFGRDIIPWLQDEIILAYREIGPNMRVDPDDVVLILPTQNMLQAAFNLSRILQGQDIPDRENYRDSALYLGDKTTFVFEPQVVLIGSTENVKAMLDVRAGEADSLVDESAYSDVTTEVATEGVLSGYVNGTDALRILSVLLDTDESALPVLESYGQALAAFRDDDSLEQFLLNNQVDGVSFNLRADTLRRDLVHTTVTLHVPEYDDPPLVTAFNPALLDLLPQNAMVVHSGTDMTGAAYDLLVALPLSNFSSQFLSAFPVGESVASANDLLDLPDAAALEQAVGGLINALGQQADFDLEDDLLQHLDGSYTVALLPRPNDPLPGVNIPYDVLLIAEVDDSVAALQGASRLTRLLLAQSQSENSTVEDLEFEALRFNEVDEPVLRMGLVDDLLLVATGDALDYSLQARRGDDRLVSRERWQTISRDSVPQLYVDLPAFYNTFLPGAFGGGVQLQDVVRQLGWHSDYLGDGLFQISLTVTLPSQLG